MKILIFGSGKTGKYLERILSRHHSVVLFTKNSKYSDTSSPDLSDFDTIIFALPENALKIILNDLNSGSAHINNTRNYELKITENNIRGKSIGICSGFLNISELDCFKKQGAETFILHPAFSINNESDFCKGTFLVSGCIGCVKEMFSSESFNYIFKKSMDMKKYHTACSAISGIFGLLIQDITPVLINSGLSEKECSRIVHSLVSSIIHNSEKNNFQLTGPSARKDMKTFRDQLRVLSKESESLGQIYKYSGEEIYSRVKERESI